MDEEELVQRSRAGDMDSFNRLVEKYQGALYNLALRMLRRPAEAEDATQEAFLAAFRNLGQFRGGSFRAWLFHITANACRDEMRRARRHSTLSLEALAEAEPPFTPASQEASPDEVAQSRELGQALSHGLAQLPQEQRLALILRDILGLSYEEMAQTMGTSLGTVRSRISRGRDHLRRLLAQGELLPDKYRLKK